MDHVALAIWDAIPTIKSCDGIGSGRRFGWAPRSKGDQILWRFPRRGRWSLLDPDVFRRTSVATLLRRRIKHRSSRKSHSKSEGSTCLPIDYVIPRAFSLTEPCSNNVVKYNALFIGMQIIDEIGVKNLEAYGDSKIIVNHVPHSWPCTSPLKTYFYIDHVTRQ